MTKGVTARQQREDRLRLRRKRLLDVSGALQGAIEPVRVVPVPSAAPRASAGLPAHKYPVRKVSLGDRQSVGPIGRREK